MAKGDTSLIRRLAPTKWMFDLYTDEASGHIETFSKNYDKRPFFGSNIIRLKEGYIDTIVYDLNPNELCISFSSICDYGYLGFEKIKLSLSDFIRELENCLDKKRDYITFNVPVKTTWGMNGKCNFGVRHGCPKWDKLCIDYTPSSHQSGYYSSAMAAVQFNFNDIREALAVYHGIKNYKGENEMKNSMNQLFSNMEMGMNKDRRIKSTLMGIVVQNPETQKWYAFDPATRTRKDMMNLKFGDFPIVLLPVRDLTVGDLIKRDGKYYYVQSTDAPNTFTGINAMTGEVQTFLYEQTLIPGLNFFTKVVAFDAKTLMDPNSKQNMGGNVLGAMLMMQMMNSDKAEFSLDDINDDSFNGLGAFMPLLLASKDGNLGITNADGTPNIMAMMMLCSDGGSGGMNDFMKVTLLSNLIGGNNTAPTNIFGNMFQGFSGAPASAEPTISVVVAKPEGEYVCNICGKVYTDENIHFCPACGGVVTKKIVNACKKCGAELKPDAKFCHVCGAKIGPDTCAKCNVELPEGAAFCPSCGHKVGAPFVPKPATSPAPAKKRTAKAKAQPEPEKEDFGINVIVAPEK